jgi:small subunit ribosomal protein S9
MPVKKPKKEIKEKDEKYYEAVGRRKTATARARVRLGVKKEEITANGKNFTEYFKSKEQLEIVRSPFVKTGIAAFSVTLKIAGGGLQAQADASRHAISRALVIAQPELKIVLKTIDFLTRDPRKKERKKPGLKGARRAPQWSKR